MKIFKYIVLILFCTAILLYFLKQYNNENQINNSGDKLMNINNIEKEQEDLLECFFNKPTKIPNNTFIKIIKSDRILELYGDQILIGRFKIALGKSPVGHKNVEGDSKTPIGKYYICTRNDNSRFTLFLGVSYPNSLDAKRGLQNNLIDENTANSIIEAQRLGIQPHWKTPLGGEIGIHGGGNIYDWTLGCIALSDDDIRIIWDYAPLNTPVEIYE